VQQLQVLDVVDRRAAPEQPIDRRRSIVADDEQRAVGAQQGVRVAEQFQRIG